MGVRPGLDAPFSAHGHFIVHCLEGQVEGAESNAQRRQELESLDHAVLEWRLAKREHCRDILGPALPQCRVVGHILRLSSAWPGVFRASRAVVLYFVHDRQFLSRLKSRRLASLALYPLGDICGMSELGGLDGELKLQTAEYGQNRRSGSP